MTFEELKQKTIEINEIISNYDKLKNNLISTYLLNNCCFKVGDKIKIKTSDVLTIGNITKIVLSNNKLLNDEFAEIKYFYKVINILEKCSDNKSVFLFNNRNNSFNQNYEDENVIKL